MMNEELMIFFCFLILVLIDVHNSATPSCTTASPRASRTEQRESWRCSLTGGAAVLKTVVMQSSLSCGVAVGVLSAPPIELSLFDVHVMLSHLVNARMPNRA
jgi:hypothetical protein